MLHQTTAPPLFRYLLFSVVMSLLGGCRSGESNASRTTTDGRDRIKLMLNWYPEAEHGGYYSAQVHGIFESHGLEVEIRPGGPAAPVAQELVAGRVDFAIANADDVLVFREQDVPVVALLAPIQDTPRCILVHEESQVSSLSGLAGMTLQAGSGRPYLEFLRTQGLLEGVQVVPYSGVPKFVADTNNAMQAYTFSEPMLAEQQGARIRTLMVSEIGFNPYASCLIATESFVEQNPELVSRMVEACLEGWIAYFESSVETNAAILAANQHGMTDEVLQFGAKALRPLCLPDGMPPEEMGRMTVERWQTLIDQFSSMDLVDPDKVTVEQVFTTDFLNMAQTLDQPQN